MNLPDFALAVVNTARQSRTRLRLTARVLSLDNRVLNAITERVDAPANTVTTVRPLPLAPILQQEGVVLVTLTLEDSNGARLSENVYWQARDEDSYQKLNDLRAQPVRLSARAASQPGATIVTADVENQGEQPVLAVKLTALDERGERTLPVYYSDNYLTLLPGERRQLQIECPGSGATCAQVAIRGWNVQPRTESISSSP
jgi:hypothetical protein